MVGDVFGFDGLEGTGTHMQRHARALHAARFKLRQDGFVKMQRGSWRGDGAGVFGKHRLVAGFVVLRVSVRDVGRQRHMTMLRHQRIWVTAKPEAVQRPLRVWPTAQQGGGEAAVHLHHRAGQRFFAHPHVRRDLMA